MGTIPATSDQPGWVDDRAAKARQAQRRAEALLQRTERTVERARQVVGQSLRLGSLPSFAPPPVSR